MVSASEWSIESTKGGNRYVREWPNPKSTWIALLSHGYGEHIGRYDDVADTLHKAGAVAVGPDHEGHGRSGGERVLIADFEAVVDDLHAVAVRVREKYPNLPMVLIGHSMGGMIAARYAQRYSNELAAVVLSGPMFGAREILEQLMAMDPIPEIPIDPATLSRNPDVGRAYADDPLVWHGAFKKPTLQAMMAAMDTIEAEPPLEILPTLWIHGEADMLVPMAQTRPMIEHLQGKAFDEKIYPGAMHEVFNEVNRDEVIADVISFVHGALAKAA